MKGWRSHCVSKAWGKWFSSSSSSPPRRWVWDGCLQGGLDRSLTYKHCWALGRASTCHHSQPILLHWRCISSPLWIRVRNDPVQNGCVCVCPITQWPLRTRFRPLDRTGNRPIRSAVVNHEDRRFNFQNRSSEAKVRRSPSRDSISLVNRVV